MDIQAIIDDLQAEKQRLVQTIAAVESLISSQPIKHRGRKFMGQAERQQVAERMRRYWATRRKAHAGA